MCPVAWETPESFHCVTPQQNCCHRATVMFPARSGSSATVSRCFPQPLIRPATCWMSPTAFHIKQAFCDVSNLRYFCAAWRFPTGWFLFILRHSLHVSSFRQFSISGHVNRIVRHPPPPNTEGRLPFRILA